MKYSSTKKGYANLWRQMVILPARRPVARKIAESLGSNRDRYATVGKRLGIPWYFIAIIHHMESGANFRTHLHNGDPLTARTRRVPSARPVLGSPPFTWEESAEDALRYKALDKIEEWPTSRLLYEFERYNGFGYFSRKINSPYLWSFSNLYKKGKYVRDGVYDPSYVSKQCGAAVILRAMQELDLIESDPMNELQKAILPFGAIVPILHRAIDSPVADVAISALAEVLDVEPKPEEVSESLKARKLKDRVDVLAEAEALLQMLEPKDADENPVDDVLEKEDAPVVEPLEESPIDRLFPSLKGYKTIIGLGIGTAAYILDIVNVITPDTANVVYGLAVLIGGVGVKAWMDRLRK